MEWIDSISKAIDFIELNILDDLTIDDIANEALISPFYFQKGFSMLCGFSVGEYIRLRRLSLAGSELVSTDDKIIDIAIKYGYDSPDSFTKAFTRFHGATPTAVRKNGAMLKSFASLKINFTLKGGYTMDYKIIEKDAFTIIGSSRFFGYNDGKNEIPQFWNEHYQKGDGKFICGMFGVCIDENKKPNEFEYLIADNYDPSKEMPENFITKVIPKHTWAVFACKGPMPQSLQGTNEKIFSEWLPNCKDYEIAANLNIEMYSAPNDYPNGTSDENYYSEIWIPIKKK